MVNNLGSTSDKFNDLTDEQFKILCRQYPICDIAGDYNVMVKTVSRRAHKLDIVLPFQRRGLDEIERARLVKLRESGMEWNEIAAVITTRSAETLRRTYGRIKNPEAPRTTPEERYAERYSPWPKLGDDHYMIFQKMDGRKYDDMPDKVLEREWPKSRKPLDCTAMIRASAFSNMGCGTAMCSE